MESTVIRLTPAGNRDYQLSSLAQFLVLLLYNEFPPLTLHDSLMVNASSMEKNWPMLAKCKVRGSH